MAIVNTFSALWNHSVDGGSVGSTTLTGSPIILSNTVIYLIGYDVITQPTSSNGTALLTVGLTQNGAFAPELYLDGFLPGTYIVGQSTKNESLLPSVESIKTTQSNLIDLKVSTQALTGGKIRFLFQYFTSA